MRPLLHLLSVALVLPIVAFAFAFIILGRAIATGSLLGLLGRLLFDAIWIIPWAILAVCAVLLMITLGGLFVRTRWLAALCVAVLGIVSTAVVIVLTVVHSNASFDDLLFYVPGAVASYIGAWFALTERPRREARAGA